MAVAERNSVGSKLIRPTTNLEDNYVLGARLGWGQFGIIREVTHKHTGEVLACKSIPRISLMDVNGLQNVKLEIEIMTKLSSHPNVVHLKAVYEEEDYVHLVMELCAGGELFDRLDKHGRFVEDEARILFRQLMQVVAYCHDNGIVHRDLKPENILLATKTASSPIKLADFGLATYIRSGGKSLHGTVGSPFYIAPEVLSGGYNQSADVWSAGVILYILLSATPPFWGKTKSRIFDAVRFADLRFPDDPWDLISDSAKSLIMGMLCIDPLRRLTAQQVLGHPWTTREPLSDVPHGLCNNGQVHNDIFMIRNQDISFNMDGNLGCNLRSSLHVGRSSFRSFMEASAPSFQSEGFTFHADSDIVREFSHPLVSVPSFAFSNPQSTTQQTVEPVELISPLSKRNAIHAGGSLAKLLSESTNCLCFGSGETEVEKADVRMVGVSNLARNSGLLSKRNRTIGLGELEHLDVMVTESVIRWASCTNLPNTPSLKSSLVC